MVDFRFKDGFRPKALKASVVALELERIKRESTELTAEAVFDAARPAKALLHGEFEWDGPAAIRALGLDRARKLIRAVVIVPTEREQMPHRVWVHVSAEGAPNGGGAYQKAEVVVRDVDLFERAVSELQRKFDAAAEALTELKALVASADPNADRMAAIGLAVQGFGAVREALAILK
jgi:hypothetical protein